MNKTTLTYLYHGNALFIFVNLTFKVRRGVLVYDNHQRKLRRNKTFNLKLCVSFYLTLLLTIL